MNIIQHEQWSLDAEQGLNRVLSDDKSILENEIALGHAQLWEIKDFGSWMITRTEKHTDEKVLVICCYQGQELNKVGELIVAAAKAQGFTQLRYHTKRRGLNRLLKNFDFQYQETVYHKDLSKEIT